MLSTAKPPQNFAVSGKRSRKHARMKFEALAMLTPRDNGPKGTCAEWKRSRQPGSSEWRNVVRRHPMAKGFLSWSGNLSAPIRPEIQPSRLLPENIVLFGDGREIGRALAGMPFDAARVVLHVGDEGER